MKNPSFRKLIRAFTKYFLAVLVSLLLLFTAEAKNYSPVSRSGEIDKKLSESKNKLNDYNEKLLLEKNKLEKLKKDKTNVLGEIKKLNDSIAVKEKELEVYKTEYEGNLKLLNDLQKEIYQHAENISSARERLGKRLRALYKQGTYQQIEIIYDSKNYLEFLQKIKLLQIVSKNDANLIGEFEKEIGYLEESKKSLTDSKNRSLETFEKIKMAEKEILTRKNEKEHFLSEINSDEKRRTSALKKLQDDSKNLQKLIKNLLKEKISSLKAAKGDINSGKLNAVKGNLPWPAEGKIVKFFGKQLYGELNTYIYNTGITISVGSEKKFTSIFAGTVIFSDNLSGYGKVIIIDHGGSLYSVYGNAGELYTKIGDKITQGKMLGKVDGELYFEIRLKGTPQDPLTWLKGK